MIEYANDTVIKLLKQYDMLAKSLNYIDDITQKNEICNQMTKIIKNVLEITNSIYEEKYKIVEKRPVYLMEDEKNRLSELINLINERRVYVNNQLDSNQELTGVFLNAETILGEDKLDEYKTNVKIIERYKNNMRLEIALKDEIKNLDIAIKKANEKISNNKSLNRQLEEKMIRLVGKALEKLSLFELKEKEKEIDLAYTELGFSLEKAKENAKIARRDCTEEIILECDNILASTTLDYERYKEKKLILKLIYIYKNPVSNYEELLNKREEINTILLNITDSELYSIIGNELNKEYSTIKLEAQDVATLKSLMEEKEIKAQSLKKARQENNSESIKGMLATLLENEKKHQQELEEEKKKKELERIEQEKIEERRRLEERAKRQKALEEERKKEIEERTKQLLVEKKNSVLTTTKEEKKKPTEVTRKKVDFKTPNIFPKTRPVNTERRTVPKQTFKIESVDENRIFKSENIIKQKEKSSNDIFSKQDLFFPEKEDLFGRKTTQSKVTDKGIPVIKDNRVIAAKKSIDNENKIFPEIPINKKEEIFPDMTEDKSNNSFFDENEFNDLSNYMEGNKKKSWF